jgi:uncharacterized protein (DUF58 family)
MAKFKINIGPSIDRLDLIIKGQANGLLIGNYASGFKGYGIEFADFRPYAPDDDSSRIDWKTSARSDKLLIKEFVEDRNIDVFFMVDVSSKMMLGSTKRLKVEYVADLVASLAHTILKTGDKVGLLLFSDKVTKLIHPENGMGHFNSISHVLSDLKYYGGGCNIKTAVEKAVQVLDKGSVVFLISDFITEENIESAIGYAGHRLDFTAVVVRDPIDMNLPKGMGQIMMKDPVTGERILVQPGKIADYYAVEARSDLKKVKKSFTSANVDSFELRTNESFVNKVIEFFEWRKSRWK